MTGDRGQGMGQWMVVRLFLGAEERENFTNIPLDKIVRMFVES
jgi:hypothetical protein